MNNFPLSKQYQELSAATSHGTRCRQHTPRAAPPLPAGVDDITAVVIILLEGNPKDKAWTAAQKLMNNVDKFLERLRGFKAVIDQGQVRGFATTTGWASMPSTRAGVHASLQIASCVTLA